MNYLVILRPATLLLETCICKFLFMFFPIKRLSIVLRILINFWYYAFPLIVDNRCTTISSTTGVVHFFLEEKIKFIQSLGKHTTGGRGTYDLT